MDNKNNKKINNNEKNKNKIVSETAASVEIKRKRGRPKKTENNNFIELKNNKKINKNNNNPAVNVENTDIIQVENNNAIQVKKRGRPKGSTDITQRKTRKDNLQAVLPDDVKRKILQFNLILFRLPKITDKNDVSQINERTNLFFDLCSEHGITPTVAGYSLSLGIDRHTLWMWLNEKTDYIKNTECYHIIKNAYDFINSGYENLLTEGKIIPVSAFFLLQNNYGYKQQTDHVITAKQDNQDTEEDIVNRANLLEG